MNFGKFGKPFGKWGKMGKPWFGKPFGKWGKPWGKMWWGI